MASPRVTVLMTAYNCERFIRDSVGSVLGQTYHDFELLIVDDASTDGTFDILSSFDDARIRILRNESNRGVAYSRKKALANALGEYVAILDADDISLPSRLEEQIGYLDENPSVALVGSANYVMDDNGNIIDKWAASIPAHVIRWKLLFGNCLCHSTVMFRRQAAIEVGGYDESVFAGEDFDFYVRMALRHDIAALDSVLALWRRTSTGLGRVEPLAVKEHFVRTVAGSIRARTGIAVPLEVARCLFGNAARAAADVFVLRKGFATIVECFASMTRDPALDIQKKKDLMAAALEDILRLARQNRGSGRLACRALLQCLAKGKKFIVINTTALRICLLPLQDAHGTKIPGGGESSPRSF